MISRIENGLASPSLATVNALATALNVPAAYLLGDTRRQTDVSFVKAGGGLSVERRGAGAGHMYQLLGHSPHAPVLLEPYLITLGDKSEDFEMLVHPGIEFMYVLTGSFVYRVADRTYELSPGDSLCFDAGCPHGPEKLLRTPIKLLAVIGTAPV
jgi:mannose-6-phosphate isomerase-like protein (cupin superfamily)